MKWVAGNTSLPVPKVYCSFEQKGVGYIVMEHIDGEVIARNWRQQIPKLGFYCSHATC
jgi:hypothetical protein